MPSLSTTRTALLTCSLNLEDSSSDGWSLEAGIINSSSDSSPPSSAYR
eukprot:CAMPEP_0201728632 /NCGR_PEP_ID=MMETSP0593-20130828/16559_1 /ASSEMBLY_ACC=CAM_ASM_000672 /TAXON_ID=267983 /ORGANISM="Skeletonema japonicum, Strain CCMP2506" /LENGTH=47 /DNA_ID= /DNA_START= /DNA_END= /DNA_ORIENTATION=